MCVCDTTLAFTFTQLHYPECNRVGSKWRMWLSVEGSSNCVPRRNRQEKRRSKKELTAIINTRLHKYRSDQTKDDFGNQQRNSYQTGKEKALAFCRGPGLKPTVQRHKTNPNLVSNVFLNQIWKFLLWQTNLKTAVFSDSQPSCGPRAFCWLSEWTLTPKVRPIIQTVIY